MRSLKTPQALAHAAQIGKLIESTVRSAAESRDENRQMAAAWWKRKLEPLLQRSKQTERG